MELNPNKAYKILKCLYDVRESIDEMDSYFDYSPVDFENYKLDRMRMAAVERKFEIIGEAFNRILKIFPEFELPDVISTVNQRNFIIHAYDSVDSALMWDLRENYIPKLKQDVDSFVAIYEDYLEDLKDEQ